MEVCVGCCEIAFSSIGWLSLPQGNTKCMSMGGNCFRWPSVFMILNVRQPGCVVTFTKYEIVLWFFLLLLFCFDIFALLLLLWGFLVLL